MPKFFRDRHSNNFSSNQLPKDFPEILPPAQTRYSWFWLRKLLFVRALIPSRMTFGMTLAVMALGASSAWATTSINHQFSPSVINQGSTSLYTITVTNDSLVPLTGAKATIFLDNTVGAPNVSGGRVTIATGAVLSNTCGFGGVTAVAGDNKIVLTAGSVAAGTIVTPAQCTFSLNVTSTTVGTFHAVFPANTSPSPTVTGYEATENAVIVQNGTTADITLQVNALSAPTGSKSYSPSPAIAGDPTTLTITLTNPNNNATIALTSFVDNLPTGMQVAATPAASVSCTGTGAINGVFSPASGDTALTLTGGTIGNSGTCTMSVKVVVPTVTGTNQVFNNSLPGGAIGNTRGLTSSAFNTNLTVNSPIAVSKSFAPTTVPAGQASLMTITLTNNSTTLPLSITSFADNLSGTTLKILTTASSPVAASANPSVSCTGVGASNGTLTAPPDTLNTTLSLANAVVGPKSGANGKCVITAYVTSNVDGTHINTIAADAVVNPSGHHSPSASANLAVNGQLTVGKTVTVNQVAPGQWTQFTVTISNWSGGSLSNVSFLDTLPQSGGQQMVLQGVNPASSVGCTGGTWTGADGAAALSWASGSIAAGVGANPGLCTIVFKARLPITATTGMVFTNQIPINGGTGTCNGVNCSVGDGNGVTNPGTSPGVNVTTVDSVAMTKSFSPTSIAQGGQSTLTLRIRNRSLSALTAVNLTDNLPAGLILAANPAATSTGCGGTLEAFPSNNQLKLIGGTIAARADASVQTDCTITAKVTGTALGIHTNTIAPADLLTSGGTIPSSVSAQLTITTGLTGSKAFSPGSVTSGGKARVTITAANGSNGQLTNVGINDATFSGGLSVANPANAATSCAGSPTMVVNPGATNAQLLGATLAAGSSCDFSFDVMTSGTGPWSNTVPIGAISSAEGVSNSAAVTASLSVVGGAININKSFNPVVVTGGVPSTLTLVLTNPTPSALQGVGFTDTFPLGIQVYPVPDVTSTCAGGTVTAVGGDGKMSLSGASMAANSTCTVTLQVTSVKFLNLTNVIPAGAVVSVQGYTNPSLVSATLTTLQGLGVMKAFSPAYVIPNAVTRLKMWLVSTYDQNAPTPLILTGVSYTDTLPAGILVAPVPNPTTTCVGPNGAGVATITAAAGSNLVTVSSATIAPGSICSTEVDVVAPGTTGTYTNLIPANSITTDQGPTNSNPASAKLYVVNLPTVAKAFSPTTVSVDASSTLTVTVANGSGVALTGVSLQDSLPAGLDIANPATPATTCSNGVVGANPGGNTLTLSGATIPAGGSCTFSAKVVSHTAASYVNTIPASAITSNEGPTNPGSANDTLIVRTTPTVSKSFSPVSILAGGTSTLTISFGNSNASAISLNSAFVDALPGNVFVDAAPTVGGTCTGAVTAVAGANSITYASGASIPSGGCTITVHVTSSIGGVYTNGIAAGQLVTSAGVNQDPAFASLAVGAGALVPPSIGKVFSPSTIDINGLSTLTLTLGNLNASALTLGADLVDNLPAGVVVASPSGLGGTCTLGSVTANAGASTISYANGASLPTAGCTIVVNVTSAAAGSYTNTIPAGALVTNGGSNPQPAIDALVVASPVPPSVIKAFGPNTINPGGISRLTIDLGNGNGGSIALNSPFTDTLPAGMTVAAAPNIGGSCALASISAVAGSGSVSYAAGASIPAGGCSIQVDVTSVSAAGSPYTNTIAANALSTSAGFNGAPTAAKLFVNPPQPPSINKSFAPKVISVGGVSVLTLSLGNGNATAATLTANLVDTLPANVVLAPTPGIAGSCTLGSVTAAAGGTTITYASGASIPAGGCSISVNVTSAVANAAPGYTNTIPIGGLQTNVGNNAVATSDTLLVLNLPTVTKAFASSTILLGATSTLTITLGNANASAITLTSILTDSLPAGVVVATPNALAGTCTAGSVSATAGGTSVSYASGASIASGGCTIIVNVTSTVPGVYTNTIAAGALKTTIGNNPAPAGAVLTVLGPPTISKSFAPKVISVGGVSVLTLSLGNGNATAATLTTNLVDTLPANVVLAPTPGIAGSCTLGSVTAAAGGSTITYASGASIPAGGCSISVNVTSAVANAAPGYTNTIPIGGLQTNAGNNAVATSDTLFVSNLPTVTKAFAPSTIAVGATSTLTITLGNANASAITLTSILTDSLPAGVVVATPNALAGTCTAGSVSATAGGTSVTYASGASIPAGGCSISVNVTSAVANAAPGYTNTIPVGGLQTNAGNNAVATSDTLLVLNLPTVTKTFAPSTIAVGATSTLTITLGNANASAITLTSILTDSLPAGVVVATPNALAGTCATGSVSATAGGTSVSYASSASTASGGCTIIMNVTSTVPGVYTNTIAAGALKTTIGNNPAPASAVLTVLGAPSIAKSFSPTAIEPGGKSVLTINLGNANGVALTLTSALTDTLPAGMTVAATPAIGGTCPGTTTAASGSGTVVYANGSSIPAGGCTITVNVTASAAGSYVNTIAAGALGTTGGSNPTPAAASLTVAILKGIPTLSQWGVIILSSLVALLGLTRTRRRPCVPPI